MKLKTKKRDRKSAIAAMALGAIAACQAFPAHADDTATEIRLLKERLKQLEQRVAEQGRKEKLHQASAQPGGGPGYYGPPSGQVPGPGAYYFGIGLPPQPSPGGLTATETDVRGIPTVGPSSIWFKGISITPGGFMALESVTRNPFVGADIGSPPFSAIPFENVPSSHASEFRFSARQSRLSLLAQGNPTPSILLTGYVEGDFLAAPGTANSNESNSFSPRMRHIYATVDDADFNSHLLAGQNWSLATMNTKGIIPRQEDIPLTIDAQYVPGFVWARQPQIRYTQDFFDHTLWFAVSAENPATTTGGTVPVLPGGGAIVNGVGGLTAFAAPTTGVQGGTLFNTLNGINITQMPDIIGKVAWEPTIFDRTIHMEAFGIFRDFVNRVVYPYGGALPITNPLAYGTVFQNHNNNTFGDGVGGSILIPVLPKVLDVQFSGLTGRGIGRYGSSQFSDVTYYADGSLAPLQTTMLLAGAVWHALPELDVYGYAGQESVGKQYGISFGKPAGGTFAPYGYGNPLFNNSSCDIEDATFATAGCAGNTSLTRQATIGFWDNIYKGPFGRLAGGLQYSFTQRYGFAGYGPYPFTAAGAPAVITRVAFGGTSPERNASTFLTSIRYYPF